MSNIVNLSDRRQKPAPLPEELPPNAGEIMAEFIAQYIELTIDTMPMGLVLA